MPLTIIMIMTFQFCYEEIVSNIKYINIILSPEKYIVNRRIIFGKGLLYICDYIILSFISKL